MTAEQRGMELMSVIHNDLPPLARDFASRLCRELGGCMEVFLTAFCIYAHLVEGLESTDPAYAPRPQDAEWFTARKA